MNGSLTAITAFQLTTCQPDRLARFYAGLGFAFSSPEAIPDEEMALLGVAGRGTRLPSRLGAQRLDLDTFVDTGRPYPAGATSADLCFQHVALITNDAVTAWKRATALGATPISVDGPVTLPPEDGGVTAVKLRDPEGHPFEFLQFPPGPANPWHGAGLLGIDHSAIGVSDATTSRRFYEALGLSARSSAHNHGPAQTALDGLAGVEVEVVPMLPRRQTPHLELLAYRTPTGRFAGRLRANDVAATRIIWQADRNGFIRDPDGHLHVLRLQARDM